MNPNLHRQLLRRVLLSALFIAILAALVTLMYQTQKMEEHVKSVASETGNSQVSSFLQRYRDACEKQHTIEPNINLDETGFVFIEIFDTNMKLVFSKTTETYPKIHQEINAIDHHIAYNNNTSDIKLIHNHIENRFYIQILSPALLSDNKPGYIKVLYRVSDKEIQQVYTEIIINVLLAIASIIILFAILYPVILFLNKKLIQRTKALADANLEMMDVLASAIAKRDHETDSHNYRVTLYALALGEALELDDKAMAALLKGAFLHDVGKIGISDTILLKPDKLNEEEYTTMKLHVAYGQEIIAQSSWLKDARDVIAYHHERYDGSGYLKGLKGEDIPLNARIFTIIDVFDALTSSRPYKEAYTYERSIAILKEGSGTHFDPKLLEQFIAMIAPTYALIAGKEDIQWLKDKLLPYMEHYL